MNNNHSVWQKVDLHIHTDWSKKTKNDDYKGLFSVETLHEKLIEQNVRIFSLTDHNIINLPAYKEYYNKFSSDDDPLLLLGIELDIERKSKTYHSLLIFNCSSYESAEDINEKLESKFTEKGLSNYERKLTVDEIIAIFPEKDFFFIPHAGNTASIVDGYKGEVEEAQKMLILFQSPLEKVPEKKRQIYNENFDKVLYEGFRNKDDYAYIEFSDNHNIHKYPCKHKGDTGIHDFYYIKGSKNYETLRLSFIDPKSRIKSSIDYNSINQPRNYIESLRFNSSKHIKDCRLDFSPHLNVIIGGRSSGKSLLMDIISRNIEQLNVDSKYDNIEKGLECEIKSKFDAAFKQKTSIDTSIIQINQGDIVNFFENNRLEELAKKTEKIEEYKLAKEKFVDQKDKLHGLIENLKKSYEEAYSRSSIKNYTLHSHTIEKFLSSEYLLKVDFQEIEKKHYCKEALSNDEEILVSISENIQKLQESDYFSFTPEENKIILDFETLINEKKKDIDSAIQVSTRVSNFLSKVKEDVENANSKLNNEGKEKLQAQESISKKASDSKLLFNSLSKMKSASMEVESYILSHKESIALDYESNLCLEVTSKEKVSDLIIEGIRGDNSDNLYICLLKLLNGVNSVKNFGDNKPVNLNKKIKTQLNQTFMFFENPKDFLEYGDGTNSKSNSPGYNSEKYLQVILNNPSSNLIIIDQPEDNLGNRFISEQLVDLVRGLKFKKQMFLVTHNPAIVVYGDAESIIYANNDNNEINYTQIKLEDEVAQRNICGVLDGGEYIFDNRAKKYNIQRLLNNED